jgi:hypothetical protein
MHGLALVAITTRPGRIVEEESCNEGRPAIHAWLTVEARTVRDFAKKKE